MPSPFPGMDPYLEGALWPDLHGSLIYTIRAAIAAALPEGYFAGIDQYVWLTEADTPNRSRKANPDVFLTDGPSSASAIPGTALAEPTVRVMLSPAAEPRTKRYIRLIDLNDQSVITVLELLSPSDKQSKKDRTRYLAKRDEYFGAGANLVEIDLLRRGQRVPMGEPAPPKTDYSILVSRADQYPAASVWAFTVRDPIPVVPVPLKPEHGNIPLDLRACFDRVYDESRYATRLDYTIPARPALSRVDALWAAEVVKSHRA